MHDNIDNAANLLPLDTMLICFCFLTIDKISESVSVVKRSSLNCMVVFHMNWSTSVVWIRVTLARWTASNNYATW